jgi:hypothetical protein
MINIGTFGACLNDPGNPPRFYTLLQIVGGVGLFRPIDDPGAVVQFAIDDFWPLVDLTQ